MESKLERREVLRRLALLVPAATIASFASACSKKPNCSDESSLSPEDRHIRDEVAKYVDESMEAAKRCSGCLQFISAKPDQCGGCKVLKGPINPNGYCTLYVAKPS